MPVLGADSTKDTAPPIVVTNDGSSGVSEMSSTPVSLEEEYMKNPDLKKEDIETLKQWAQSQQNIPEIKEIQLILFHHSCYYNLEDTKSCIQIYYSLRMSTPDLFDNRCLSQPELKKATEVLRYGAFPIKDPNGYQIMFHGLQDYDPSRYVLADALKVLFMGVEACTYVEGTVPGYIFLFDMTGVRLGHITRLSLTLLKKVLTYIQDAIPVRLKAIHIINTLPLIDKVMFLMKPFMKKELLKMIHFHSSNNEEIQKYLPKPCIPVDFGGDLPSCSEMQEMYVKWIRSLEPMFKDEEETRWRIKNFKNKNGSNKELTLTNLNLD